MSKSNNVVTGVGKAVYPRLVEPDYKFNTEDGEYSCRLHLEKDQWEELKVKVDKIVELGYKRACAKEGKQELRKHTPGPLRITDEGDYEVRAKQVAQKQTSKGMIQFSFPIYDSQGNKMEDPPNIGSGSMLSLNLEVRTWYVNSLGFGYTLSPKGVQLIDLVEYGGGSSAESLGFKAVENGFVSESLEFDKSEEGKAQNQASSVPF
tara:strand:- start:8708 stop:9325 length:618 start_codon:yes stop_codon:yes gene_type:complete